MVEGGVARKKNMLSGRHVMAVRLEENVFSMRKRATTSYGEMMMNKEEKLTSKKEIKQPCSQILYFLPFFFIKKKSPICFTLFELSKKAQ